MGFVSLCFPSEGQMTAPKSAFPFYHVVSKNWTQVVRLSSRHPHLATHLLLLGFDFLKKNSYNSPGCLWITTIFLSQLSECWNDRWSYSICLLFIVYCTLTFNYFIQTNSLLNCLVTTLKKKSHIAILYFLYSSVLKCLPSIMKMGSMQYHKYKLWTFIYGFINYFCLGLFVEN